MAKHLTQCFVYLCVAGLASQVAAEVRFNHAENCLLLGFDEKVQDLRDYFVN
jgi:hypothetical protein